MMLHTRIPRIGLVITILTGLTVVTALFWVATVWASAEVTFSDVPDEHGGERFTFTLTYNNEPVTQYKKVRDEEVAVDGGSVPYVKRAHSTPDERNYVWAVTIEPDDTEDVTITVRGVTVTVPHTYTPPTPEPTPAPTPVPVLVGTVDLNAASERFSLSASSMEACWDKYSTFSFTLENGDVHPNDPVDVFISSNVDWMRVTPDYLSITDGQESDSHTVTLAIVEERAVVNEAGTISLRGATIFGINGALQIEESVTVTVPTTCTPTSLEQKGSEQRKGLQMPGNTIVILDADPEVTVASETIEMLEGRRTSFTADIDNADIDDYFLEVRSTGQVRASVPDKNGDTINLWAKPDSNYVDHSHKITVTFQNKTDFSKRYSKEVTVNVDDNICMQHSDGLGNYIEPDMNPANYDPSTRPDFEVPDYGQVSNRGLDISVYGGTWDMYGEEWQLTLNEGDEFTIAVKLSEQPSSDVVLNWHSATPPSRGFIAQQNNGNVDIDDTDSFISTPVTSLTFTSTNWETAQTFTGSIVEDDDFVTPTSLTQVILITTVDASSDNNWDSVWSYVWIAQTFDTTIADCDAPRYVDESSASINALNYHNIAANIPMVEYTSNDDPPLTAEESQRPYVYTTRLYPFESGCELITWPEPEAGVPARPVFFPGVDTPQTTIPSGESITGYIISRRYAAISTTYASSTGDTTGTFPTVPGYDFVISGAFAIPLEIIGIIRGSSPWNSYVFCNCDYDAWVQIRTVYSDGKYSEAYTLYYDAVGDGRGER